MKFLWATDLHLDHDHGGFLAPPHRDTDRDAARSATFVAETRRSACHGWLLSGDLTDGRELISTLDRLGSCIEPPIYFVLGNHDFYGDSIARTRAKVLRCVREHQGLVYLTDCPPIPIGETAYVMGEDGWGDATEGDYEGSYVRLQDFVEIEDFRRTDPQSWKSQLQALGSESAERLRVKLALLPMTAQNVIVITHVPPFRQACWYEGNTTDDHWAPFFVCGQVGRVLREFASKNPHRNITVICGHTHHAGTAEILDNLTVHTGAAHYGSPKVEGAVSVTRTGVKISPI